MALPYFPFFPADWLGDSRITMGMTLEEEGAYHRLLCLMWVDKSGTCSVRDDDRWVAAGLRVSADDWRRIRAVIVDGPEPVLQSHDGRLWNKRLSEEWERAQTKSAKASQAADTRWHADGDANAHADASANGNARGHADGMPPIDSRSQTPEKTLGTTRPQTPRARARRGSSKPTAFDNEDARSAATAAYDALKGMGVSNLPADWFQKAVGAANRTLTEGGTPPPPDELRAAIAWAAVPERAQFKRGKLLARQFGLLVADYQAARAVPDLRPAQARASPEPASWAALREIAGGGAG